MNAAVGNGFVMRHVLRGPLLGNQEIESLVVKIDSKRIAPKEMRIPDGYTLVKNPASR